MLKVKIEKTYGIILDEEHLDWLHRYLQNCFVDQESTDDYNKRSHVFHALDRLKRGESDA